MRTSLPPLALLVALWLPFAASSHAAEGPMAPTAALSQLDRKIADLDTEESKAKAELSRLGGQIGESHARVIARGRSYYRLTRAGMLPLGGGFNALVAHAMQVERQRRTLISDIDNERKLRAHGLEVSQTLDRVARDRIAFVSQRGAMDAARMAQEDESRRQTAFDKAFEVSAGNNDFVPMNGNPGASSDFGGGSFAASKGKLLFPVLGRAEVRSAHREGTKGPGLELRAPAGSVVRAVFAGKVAFAERYGPYGRLVIIDHGDHFYTVNGNLGSFDVKVGDSVAAGDRLGAVGDDGAGAMLYFEVRKGAETIAPNAWLGL